LIKENGLVMDLSKRKIEDNHIVVDPVEMEATLKYARDATVEFDEWYYDENEYGIVVKLKNNSGEAFVMLKASQELYKKFLISSVIPITDGKRKMRFKLDNNIKNVIGQFYLIKAETYGEN
jgi:hypothetical protein